MIHLCVLCFISVLVLAMLGSIETERISTILQGQFNRGRCVKYSCDLNLKWQLFSFGKFISTSCFALKYIL